LRCALSPISRRGTVMNTCGHSLECVLETSCGSLYVGACSRTGRFRTPKRLERRSAPEQPLSSHLPGVRPVAALRFWVSAIRLEEREDRDALEGGPLVDTGSCDVGGRRDCVPAARSVEDRSG